MCVNTSSLRIPPQGVLVAWEWMWEEEASSDVSEEDVESREQYNPYIQSDSERSDENVPLTLPTQTHTVTFNCIGSTHDSGAQECLSRASRILREDGNVQIKMEPEPNNQKP